MEKAGDGLVQLRRIERTRDIAETLVRLQIVSHQSFAR